MNPSSRPDNDDFFSSLLDDPNNIPEYPIAQEIADAGGTDYLAMPLEFSGGERTAISFATDRPGGFSSAETLELYRVTSIASRLLAAR